MRAVSSKLSIVDKKAVKAVILGSVIGVIASILFTLLCSLVITLIGKLPDNSPDYISLGILAVGSLLGGYISARIYKHNGIIIGVFTGLVIFLIVFLSGVGSITKGVALYTVVKLLIILLFSIAGAIFGVNKKEKLKYK